MIKIMGFNYGLMGKRHIPCKNSTRMLRQHYIDRSSVFVPPRAPDGLVDRDSVE